MSKVCTKCKEIKPRTAFNKCKSREDGLQIKCRQCHKEFYQANIEKIAERQKQYRQNNIEKVRALVNHCTKKYRLKNREKVAESRKLYLQNNREKVAARKRAHRQANKERIKEWRKEYTQANRKKISEQASKHQTERRKTDHLFNLQCLIRRHTRRVKSKFGTKSRSAQLLGCSWEQAQTHLILTALTRYGYYVDGQPLHIDHIIPLSSAKTEAEAIALSHISNLQYLTPADNLKKSDKLDHVFGEAV